MLTPLESKAELDSHADTCVVGSNALIIQDFEKTVRVSEYESGVGVKDDCQLVSAVVVYDHPLSGMSYMLIITKPY